MGEATAAGTHQYAAFAEAARAIVSTNFVRAATSADAVAGVYPQTIVEPGDEQELAAVLKLANAEGFAVIPRGGGTKLGWGNAPKRADVVLSTARLNGIVEHAWADLTVTVDAGCTVQDLQNTLAQHGQRLALDALWPARATIGGVLATNDSGVLRLRFGALRDLIIGVTLALPDGTLAKSGGKVVKNVAGYDLPKLVTGALGTLGVITRAVFRLHPLPKESRTVSVPARNFADAQRMILAIQDSRLAHSALQLRFQDGGSPAVDALFEATQSGVSAQIDHLKALLAPAQLEESTVSVWNTRNELHERARIADSSSVTAKISILPSQIGATLVAFAAAGAGRVRHSAVLQATGIGCLLLEGKPADLASALGDFCPQSFADQGSLVYMDFHKSLPHFQAWSGPAVAFPLMQAIKRQFDPKATLNPGRFVDGI
jgi:glycolate oxidase FAD binding subunit